MVDLFSLVLSSGASWAIGRVLDSFVDCRCGDYERRGVANREYNQLLCYSCGRSLTQYVNATHHTVNTDGCVAAAAIYGLDWYPTPKFLQLYYNVDVINSAYQEVVVELVLSEFHGYRFSGGSDRYVYTPVSNYQSWDGRFHVDFNIFPKRRCIVAMDLVVYNAWGEALNWHRRLTDFNYHRKSLVSRISGFLNEWDQNDDDDW
jgi:hypothetical protein